jgi:hypothetical protein
MRQCRTEPRTTLALCAAARPLYQGWGGDLSPKYQGWSLGGPEVVPLRIVNKKLLRARLQRLLVLTPIAKPMNRFAACGDLRAEGGPRIAKMTQDEMVEWFKSAPKGSRHERMLWAARKIARLTGVTDGRAYQMLLGPDRGRESAAR